jgi:triacylglycerol lipase
VLIIRSLNYVHIQRTSKLVGKIIAGLRDNYSHITIIGHSAGGLVGRHLIQRTDYGKHIDAYVSLGTPHQGALSANLTPKIGPLAASARQMAIGSDFLKRLNSSKWPGIPALAISAGMEDVVFPRENTKFKNALNLTIPLDESYIPYIRP